MPGRDVPSQCRDIFCGKGHKVCPSFKPEVGSEAVSCFCALFTRPLRSGSLVLDTLDLARSCDRSSSCTAAQLLVLRDQSAPAASGSCLWFWTNVESLNLRETQLPFSYVYGLWRHLCGVASDKHIRWTSLRNLGRWQHCSFGLFPYFEAK